MQFTIVDVHPATYVKLGVLITVLFPLIALPLVRRFGFVVTLVPLLVDGGLACVGLRRVLMVLALTGGPSGAALAAGLAEAQVLVIAGACSTIVCAAVAAWRRPAAASARPFAFAIALLAFAEPLLAFVLARYADVHYVALWYTTGALGVCLLIGALAAFFASRGSAVRPLIVVAEVAAAVGAEAWFVMHHFQQIALGR